VTVQLEERGIQEAPPGPAYALVVVRFLLTWLGFVVLLSATALLMNIDWARPQMEQMLARAVNRQVKLGRLSWSLGLNGLAVTSNRLLVREQDGQPFISAGESEMGVAFLPLLNGQLIIRHISLSQPHILLVRRAAGRWNFSDLLKPGPDIRFVEIDQGTVDLRDGSRLASRFSPYELRQVRLKFVWPRSNRRWPFYLALKMPRQGYTTELKVTALGSGPIQEWAESLYRFDLSATDLNPADLAPVSPALPAVGGLFNLKVGGEGVLVTGIAARATAEIKDMSIAGTPLGTLKASKASGRVDLTLDKQKLAWKDLLLSFGDCQVRSHGELGRWLGGKPTYAASVQGRVRDLSKLSSMLPAGGGPGDTAGGGRNAAGGNLLSFLNPRELSGQAEFEVKLDGHTSGSRLSTQIKAKDLSAADLLKRGPLKNFPWLQALFSRPSSKLSGEVKIGGDQTVELPGADITAGGSDLHVSGSWEPSRAAARIDFSGRSVDLKALGRQCQSSKELSQLVRRNLKLPAGSTLMLAGHLDLSGQFEEGRGRDRLSLVATLKDASVGLSGGAFSASNLDGQILYDGADLSFKDVRGTMGGGSFQLTGAVSLARNARLSLKYRAQNFDLEQLNTALEICSVRLPILTQHQLYGQVQDLSLSITGTATAPIIALTLVPEDLYYHPPGLSRPLRATAGAITYEHDELNLKDVTLMSRGNQLNTSVDIANLSTTSDLKRVKVRTTGIDIADAHYYLSSTLMPPVLRQEYLDFVGRNHLSAARGKVYGNLLWQPKQGGDFDLDGVVGFYNVFLRAGADNWPFRHLAGILAASGSELLVQDVTGSMGGNQFSVNGHVTNYRAPNPTWRTELRASLYPDKVLRLLPELATSLQSKISSSGPLSVRALFNGNPQSATIIMSLQADPSDNLSISTPFGQIVQPANQAAMLDGSLTWTPGKQGAVQLNNANLLIGDSLLQAKGTYRWSGDAGQPPQLECKLLTPNPVPARTLISMLDPATKPSAVDGRVMGELTANGPITNVTSRGFLSFTGVSLPQFNLFSATGRVETPGWSFDGSDLTKGAGAGSQARLRVERAKIGALETSDVNASLVFEPSKEDPGAQKVVLKDGRASIADGTLKMNGWVDLANHKFALESNLSKVRASRLSAELWGHPGEVSGWADAGLSLTSTGIDYKELLRNLSGQGTLALHSGRVPMVAPLQEKLTQANLLVGGIFGFNLNNLLQSMVPVDTGEFKDLDAQFDISGEKLNLEALTFNGDDMRLRAAGSINLPLRTMDIAVAGNVPRVSTSVLGMGPVGDVSRSFTLQKLVSVLTFHKLESLPGLPVIGQIADDRPRAFTFRVVAPLDNPRLISQSIQKSFQWLPGHPTASAHPIPALYAR